jgi:predicted enzyme related to lactoylglutathione lyase
MAEFKFSGVMIGTERPDDLAKFYQGVFDRPADMSDGGFHGWQVGETWLSIGEHSEVKGESAQPERVILNLETAEVKAEFDRIAGLGATVVKEPYELESMWIATFADPDGNYFQLMSPMEALAGS